eukprot:2788072-Rhodomonas_salina.1
MPSPPLVFAYSQSSYSVMAAQLFCLTSQLLIVSLGFLPLIWYLHSAYLNGDALLPFSITVATLLGEFAVLVTTLLLKWIILGRQKPAEVTLWSWTYLRWWLVNNLVKVVGSIFMSPFRGTFILNWWFRLLGASIGRDVVLHSLDISDCDLITIEERTSVGEDAVVLGHYISRGSLYFGNVKISAGCSVGTAAHVGPGPSSLDVEIQPSCFVAPLSSGSSESPHRTGPEETHGVPIYFQTITCLLVKGLEGASLYPCGELVYAGILGDDVFTICLWLTVFGIVVAEFVYIVLFAILYRVSRLCLKPNFHHHLIREASSSPMMQVNNFEHTFVLACYMSVLGAKVGKSCMLTFPEGFCEYADLEIGDDVLWGSHMYFVNPESEGGWKPGRKVKFGDR